MPLACHEMSGTLAMASAVETRTPFGRSHSTPDLLSSLPTSPLPPPPPPSSKPPLHRPSSINKELPSLPAFDVPSFDLVDFESVLAIGRTKPKPTPTPARPPLAAHNQLVDEAAPNPSPPPTIRIVAQPHEPPARSNSMIDRPRSWLPSSNSSPNVRVAQIPPRPKSSRGRSDDAARVPDSPAEASPMPVLERSRTVDSFAEFAKRSWISTSRSPSPPSKADRANGASRGKLGGRARADSGSRLSRTDLDGDAGHPPAESPSSKTRALNRASIYFTRIKQKPFSSSKSSSSPSVSTLKSTKPAKSDSATTTQAPPRPTDPPSKAPKPSTPKAFAAPPAGPAKPEAAVAAEETASQSSVVSSSTPRNSSHTASSIDSASTENISHSTRSTTDTEITMPHPSSGDPLWNTFRILDTDFGKFTAKTTTSARMGMVRTTLIPFLQSTLHHPSNSNRSILSSEDIERRAYILDQWWNGLLEMLELGQASRTFSNAYSHPSDNGAAATTFSAILANMQPVTGTDRPVLLEATTMIMTRPEWRLCTSAFQPLAERSPEERVRARSGTQSSVNSDRGWVTDSAEHNVRNLFVTNLIAQVALAVDKMSARSAPMSLVNWCGKVCAYAFFFAPGVADVLVRLWGLNADLIRRVADSFGLPRKNKGESEDIVALFPPHLGKLGWTSAKAINDRLRQATQLPIMLAQIPWHGFWVSRWRGSDTDLFFIFCKYFHILAEEFLPEGLPLLEKARGPGFVLLHAQLLHIMDTTIHRQTSMDPMLGNPFGEGIHGTDAALAVPSANLLRSMEENRLIVLLQDILAESSTTISPGIQHSFAEAFMGVLKAATKRTSSFAHSACYTLCDFLEVALAAMESFQNSVNNSVATSPTEESTSAFTLEMAGSSRHVDYVDWSFWFEVGKMIMNSNNTMSEIRIISFLYTMWDAITLDPARKEAICLDWLLTEEIFEKFFNNWCPMVRAYYMRLLCWRVCRDNGSPNELDTKIFLVVSQRLRTVWSHYLWTKQSAESNGKFPPSTAPCYPTPGKRFLIIRTELPPNQPVPAFDQFSNFLPAPDFRAATSANEDATAGAVKAEGMPAPTKKKWSLLGKVLSFSAQQANGGSSGKRTWDEELEQARRETAASRTAAAAARKAMGGPPPPPKQSSSSNIMSSSDSGSSTGSAPVFEASTVIFRFILSWQGMNGGLPPMQNRILSRPRLPAGAQSRVSVRSAALGGAGGPTSGAVSRSQSPPLIRPGLPPDTRRISGLMQTGLISEARNARPLSFDGSPDKAETENVETKRLSLNIDITSTKLFEGADDDYLQSPMSPSLEIAETDRGRYHGPGPDGSRFQQAAVRAVRPTGIYASGAVYAGRALAEWAIVVGECNNFVERRRDEGVLGLAEVEVPMLTVEGLGMRQRG